MDLTDEHAASERRPLRWLLLAAVGAVLLSLVWVNVAADSDLRDGTAAVADRTVDRTEASRVAVRAQQDALDAEDRSAFLATWSTDPASQQQAARVFDNLTGLGADVTLTISPSDAGVGEVDPAADWQVEVTAAWRLPQARTRPATNPLQYDFAPDGTGHVVVTGVSAGRYGLVPIWLADDLHVRRGQGWTVAAATAADARMLAAEMPTLLAGVHRVVPAPSPAAVVYVPSDVDAMGESVGRVLGGVERLAGVAMSADGSVGRHAPVFVALNPDELGRLNKQGLTAVVAHEITHAITGVGVVEMPVWLAEGFADYVGLEVAGVSDALASRTARRDVLANGLPRSLPDDRAFAGGTPREVELAYQQSRLAVAAVVKEFGEPAVLRVYDRVVVHPTDLAGSIRAELGVGLSEVRRLWRAELRELADG